MLTVPLNVYYFENDGFIVHTNLSTFFFFFQKNKVLNSQIKQFS